MSTAALLRETAVRLVEALGAESCAISWLLGDLIIDVAQHTRTGERLVLGYGYLVSDYPLTQEVVDRGEPRALSLHDPEPDPGEARILRQMGYTALLMLPLVSGGRCRALVEVYGDGERRFDELDAFAATAIVAEAGERLEQSRTAAVA